MPRKKNFKGVKRISGSSTINENLSDIASSSTQETKSDVSNEGSPIPSTVIDLRPNPSARPSESSSSATSKKVFPDPILSTDKRFVSSSGKAYGQLRNTEPPFEPLSSAILYGLNGEDTTSTSQKSSLEEQANSKYNETFAPPVRPKYIGPDGKLPDKISHPPVLGTPPPRPQTVTERKAKESADCDEARDIHDSERDDATEMSETSSTIKKVINMPRKTQEEEEFEAYAERDEKKDKKGIRLARKALEAECGAQLALVKDNFRLKDACEKQGKALKECLDNLQRISAERDELRVEIDELRKILDKQEFQKQQKSNEKVLLNDEIYRLKWKSIGEDKGLATAKISKSGKGRFSTHTSRISLTFLTRKDSARAKAKPHAEAIDHAILRVEIALCEMVRQRSLHGFRERDTIIARRAAENARNMAETVDNEAILGRVYFWLGIVAYYENDSAAAQQCFEIAQQYSHWLEPENEKQWLEKWDRAARTTDVRKGKHAYWSADLLALLKGYCSGKE